MKTNNLESTSVMPEHEGSHVFWQRLKEFFRLSTPSSTEASADTRSATEFAGCDSAGCDGEEFEVVEKLESREFALSPHIQELWKQIFALIGIPRASSEEFPGLFKLTPGLQDGEAMIHIDVPSEPYLEGESPRMQRIVTLTVKVDHDYRLLGDDYYCIDCVPTNETRH